MQYDRSEKQVRVERIVSGGQTGADRAALDAALEAGLAIGGWCPRGRRAEDGVIPPQYTLRETPRAAYEQRTIWNVRDSDATLVLSRKAATGGTALTIDEARRQGRPFLHARPHGDDLSRVRAWLQVEAVRVLNVAGPREATERGIYAAALDFLRRLLAEAA